jgi:SAM-dependent methyltransferase
MTSRPETLALLRHLAGRPGHDEVKADFRQLLIGEFGASLDELDFERRVPEVKGRLDALIGRTVFEAKSHLDREWGDVTRRMPDYLADREREEGEPFIGIASDGLKWAAFRLSDGSLVKLKDTTLDPDRPELFLAWLDGIVALKSTLPPDPLTIRIELGQDSVAFNQAQTRLASLWSRLQNDPATALKRSLWAELLKLVYGREVESDSLFFQHTFLVIVAKCIALAVLHLREDDPARLLSGEAFEAAGIGGAVESDFFDWVLAHPDGADLVRRIMTHVRRFRLTDVNSDILKVLYESLIDRDERHGLGEYYTPDWLAAKIVKAAVDRPLEQKVLDPACGSGTFLFHAVRHYLAEAETAGVLPERRAAEAAALVTGVDIHPVAVIIARVTYLLALAPVLLHRRGSISLPVYLGDSMQLSISEIIGGKELTIRVPPPPAGGSQSGEKDANGREQLDFPDTFCRDPALFDKAIERMRTGSEAGMTRSQIEAALRRITEQHYRADVTEEQQHAIADLGKTYIVFDRLRREGRDSVWAYVARNLSRPLALASGGGWANVVVGNPPWVALRHMTSDLQKHFRELAKGERIYVGGKFATQNDLSALFTVRAAGLYLRNGGRIAFVLPLAALTRGQFERLRSGSFHTARIAWDAAWTMDDDLQPLFPVPSCVLFGMRRATSRPIAEKVRAYSGDLPFRDSPEEVADAHLRVVNDAPRPSEGTSTGGSPYRNSFRQGATLVPRVLCFVERQSAGRLGGDLAAPFVVSRRSNQEKEPWKSLPGIENRVETEFLHPVLLGESVLPYRIWRPLEAVVPVSGEGEVLDSQAAGNRGYPGLQGWMSKAERVWNEHQSSHSTLARQLDYYGKLGAQFPIKRLRLVYCRSGTHQASAIVSDHAQVIDFSLYWTSPSSLAEGEFLLCLFNSEELRRRFARYQSRGAWGTRDFAKVMFNLPIPRFDPANPLHKKLSAAAKRAEKIAAAVPLPEAIKFQRARALIRDALNEAGVTEQIDKLVTELLDRG